MKHPIKQEIAKLPLPAVRQLLAQAWVAYTTRASEEDLRAALHQAHVDGFITTTKIREAA